MKIAEKDLKDAELDLSQRISSANESSEKLLELEKQIEFLTEKASGFKGAEAEARIKLLREASDKLGTQKSLDRLFALEKKVQQMSIKSCTTPPVNWGQGGSCDAHSDWIPGARCPEGKSMQSVDIVARNHKKVWQCGFKVTCC